MAMTAKRGPSGDEMRCSGHRARARRVEEGETDHPSAAELGASLSTRDQVRACVRCAPARARVLQCRLLPCVNKDSLERLRSRIVCFGTAVLMRVRVLCGLHEIEEMRRRLRELEKLEFEIPPAPSHEDESETAVAATTVDKAEVDVRSIYVGNRAPAMRGLGKGVSGKPYPRLCNARRPRLEPGTFQSQAVDYACLPEEVQQHFQHCGTINRVTILTDSFGQPKGFAYVEFDEVEAVQNALLLNETELHGRPLKVCPKRTNIPGMKQSRGRHSVHPFYPSYGKVPRFRRFLGYSYSPYY
ncbi:polyadenylate-binding protein 1-like isoform X1 [Miscanthus floridulus]|uniref:polyadenylate-binding protein 1-like isoform X1 n=1 Tax=Miscanthus floridulus TaxID=154761 RepID=UPI00345AE352